ncbi:aspartate/glutamate racemase family protein [Aquincola sp. MAHUQ-54]|uniref:Aspartate/glutamate racemase family protein n=1 Tax=Aquincola agrisoli TaxID=3119538 RepID=A0AAW9QLV6_9BURK
MRTLGLLGGMSWESTAVYYRLLNQGVARRCGGLHSAPLRIASVDFAPVAQWQSQGQWAAAAQHLGALGAGLWQAGAQGLVLATNTMHKVADDIEARAGLPLLHIADATGAAIRAAGLRCVGLLGTRFTMEDPSIVIDRLRERSGVEVLVPAAADRARVHATIYDELCRGVVGEPARAAFLGVIDRLAARGAQGVILGCTEIMLLLDPAQHAFPLFDSTTLHARAAVDWMLQDNDPANPRDLS